MKRIVFAALLVVFAFAGTLTASAQIGATIADIYRTKKEAEIETDRNKQQTQAENNRHNEVKDGNNKQANAIEGQQSNERNDEDNRHQEMLYNACLDHNQPNCSEILFGRNGSSSIRSNNDPDNGKAMILILDNETGHTPCIQSPGQLTNEGQKRIDTCDGITALARQLTIQTWETYGKFKANLQKDELQMLGTDRGGCTGNVMIHLQKKRDYTTRDGHSYPLVMYGVIEQDDIRDCQANLNVTRNTDGDVRVVHIKRQKNNN